ncbi:PREDICTED: uncharacterized protein LOC101820514 [Ficedula albicollis]|uniref:uncharacterized protein LOC101820514 n=1 Tax=Ficedula albicollis TaxID=59894 RepID=UPI00035969C5|nr:PREDICTED: uncharacterized protein LOC101820514 [Ficedula albicollis]
MFKDEQSGIICVDKEVEEDKNRCQEEIISNRSESSNPVLVLEILRATHTHTPALFSHLLRIKTKQKRENSGLEMELRKQDLSLRLFPSPPPSSSSPLFSRSCSRIGTLFLQFTALWRSVDPPEKLQVKQELGAHTREDILRKQCLEIFENTNQNASPEAPTPWLALMGMKHSSRCLLLRRKMAENAADSTEVSEDASGAGAALPPPRARSLGSSSGKCRTTFPAPPDTSCLPCCHGIRHLPPPLSPPPQPLG